MADNIFHLTENRVTANIMDTFPYLNSKNMTHVRLEKLSSILPTSTHSTEACYFHLALPGKVNDDTVI